MNLIQMLMHNPTPFRDWKIDREKTFTKADYGQVTCTRCGEQKDKEQFKMGKYQRKRTCLDCDSKKRPYVRKK